MTTGVAWPGNTIYATLIVDPKSERTATQANSNWSRRRKKRARRGSVAVVALYELATRSG